nr:dienelactone hydrolase family protein [Corynebacterium afermentans]
MVKNGKVTSPSREHTHTLQVDGRNRTYDVVLPRGFDSEKSYPVVLGFGGWHHTSANMHDYSNLESQFPDAIVVYGQGVDNAWGGAPYADTSIEEDVAYTKAVLNDVASRYNADTSRTVAVGLSNGGGMVAALACRAPETVRGVASVAGAFYSPTVTGCTSGEVPTMIMHGTNDGVVRYDGGTRHGASYESVEDVARMFARKNDCYLLTTQSRSAGVTTFDFVGCAEPVRIERVEGGGHTWFDSPSATRQTAQFLRRYL